MTAAEIVMKRDDLNIAWGFRLTGGADLGTPFYVVKVLGRGHAERAGLMVGDMVYAINHKYVNNFTHKDAQNEILHTGDTLILNIKRGHTEGRGNTPLPEYTDPLMGIAVPPETPRPIPIPPPPYQPPPPREPTPPESEKDEPEDTVAAFKVKINPKGRIAEIEELPVTPPPTRSPSRARSRSRSMSRDRRRSASAKRESTAVQNGFVPVQNGFDQPRNGFQGVQNGFGDPSGPGETITYSKEVITQYSTILSASEQSEGDVSETVNESFVIHGGSTHKMEDVLSPEDIERDIFEEKMEEQKLKELLTGEAEVLEQGIVGNAREEFSLPVGMQHSVITYDKASNTGPDKTSMEANDPVDVLMTPTESPCQVVNLVVEDDSSDVEVLVIEEGFGATDMGDKRDPEINSIEVKLADNCETSVTETMDDLSFDTKTLSEESNHKHDVNKVEVLEQNEKLDETHKSLGVDIEISTEFGESESEENTCVLKNPSQINEPIFSDNETAIEKLNEELSANAFKPAPEATEPNEIAKSGSSCIIL